MQFWYEVGNLRALRYKSSCAFWKDPWYPDDLIWFDQQHIHFLYVYLVTIMCVMWLQRLIFFAEVINCLCRPCRKTHGHVYQYRLAQGCYCIQLRPAIARWITNWEATWGLFYGHELTLIPAWIRNHIPSKAWDGIIYPFLNFNGCTVEV